MARELAEKLERESELERRRLLRKSEQIARSLQQEQNQMQARSGATTTTIPNELPIPPRNVNHRLNGGPATRSNLPPFPVDSHSHHPQLPPEPIPPPAAMATSSSSASSSSSSSTAAAAASRAALELNYACLDLPQQHHQKATHTARDPNSTALYDTIFNVIEDPTARRNLLLKHTPEKAVPYNVSIHGGSNSNSNRNNIMTTSSGLDDIEVVASNDEEECRPPPLPPPAPVTSGSGSSNNNHGGAKQKQPHHPHRSSRYSDELAIDVAAVDLLQNRNYQKLSPAKYDLLMGNHESSSSSSSHHHQRMSSYESDEAAASQSEIETLKCLGLPAEELQEMGRRARQERIDEELARKLQDQLAHDDMSQEEKDRMVALEAQDKELARMLQERERAKAKRAKERARVKKLQREQERMMSEEDHQMLSEAYANPLDLVVGGQQQQQQKEEPAGAAGEGKKVVGY